MKFYAKQTDVKFLNYEQLKKLFETIKTNGSNRDYVMFHIAYFCGLRASEYGLLTPENFDSRNKTLYCTRLKDSDSNLVKLDDYRAKLIRGYIGKLDLFDDEPIFQSRLKFGVSRQTIDWLMKKYGKLARLPKNKRHSHVLKHSIAVHLLDSGIAKEDVQKHLGHRDITSTEIYAKYTAHRANWAADRIRKSSFIVR